MPQSDFERFMQVFLTGLGQSLAQGQQQQASLRQNIELQRQKELLETVSPSDLIRQQATMMGVPSSIPATQASLIQAIQQAAVSPVARDAASRLTPEMIGFGSGIPAAIGGLHEPRTISQALQSPLGRQATIPFQIARDLEAQSGGGVRIPRSTAGAALYPTPLTIPSVGALVESVSSELHGGRTFRQTTPQEQKRTNAEVERRIQARYEQQAASRERVKPTPKPSPAERKVIAEERATDDALVNLKAKFDEVSTGIVPGFVGAIGEYTGWNTKKKSEFLAATATLNNRLRHELFGSALTVTEKAAFMKQAPSAFNPPSVWLARFEETTRNVKALRERRLEVLRQSGVVAPGDTTPSDTRRQVPSTRLQDFQARAEELANDPDLTEDERINILESEFPD